MSFIGAAFLFALPLVAVPIAIHLYRGRQRDVIPWGAMQFLASAVTKGRSLERLEEFLLMALRALAVAALIFAIAQPMIRSSWLGLGADREVILVLDNSLSMSREVEGPSAAERMKEEALKVVDSLSGSDAVQILLAVGSEWATPERVAATGAGGRQLREIIQGVEPTLGTADLLGSLQSAVHLASPDSSLGRRIVVLTDSQANNWRTDATAAWQQLGEARKDSEFPIVIEVIDCGRLGTEIDNLAITEIKATQTLVRPGEAIDLTAEVTNVGDVAGGDTTVEWLVAGKVVGESPVAALGPKEHAQVTTTVRLEDSGVFLLTARLKGKDQVPLDQQSGLVVEIADSIPILFVHAASERVASVPASELFAAALGYHDGDAGEWHSVFEPEVILPTALGERTLGKYRAVVINGAVDLDRTMIERLDEYVRAGGGLWLALGEGVDRDSFNRNWYADGDGLCPLPLETLQIIEKTDEAAGTIHPPTREHVATMQLANTTQLDIDEARIQERWQFGPRPAGAQAVSVLLESGNGKPLVVENYVGQGRVLVQALPLGLEWSNLPVLKAYVVMIQDWLNYVTAPTTARYNLEPGTSIVAMRPEASADASAELTTSRGRKIDLVASDAEAGSVFRYSQTAVPGAYVVLFKGDGKPATEVPFYVARDSRESNLAPLDETTRSGLLASAGVRFAGQQAADGASSTQIAPRLEPVWSALLVALVALLAGELLLATRLAKQRHGFAVTMSS
ncbi:MAG: BatA domain-containing protein [Pirellulales bacterium]